MYTFESIRGAIAELPVSWFEIHPLFDGQEFDVAIIGLQSYIQRNLNLHPICLPKWSKVDLEGKPTIDRLYRSTQWEKYQMLYSLKALHKDIRFSNVFTDVNGPAKFQRCDSGTSKSQVDCLGTFMKLGFIYQICMYFAIQTYLLVGDKI